MTTYLLDMNIVSYLTKGDASAHKGLASISVHDAAISVVTQAELLYGLAKRRNPAALVSKVRELLAPLSILPWASEVAEIYAELRIACEAKGVTLSTPDMMIAAHAKALAAGGDDVILVTRNKAFSRVPGLVVEDWI